MNLYTETMVDELWHKLESYKILEKKRKVFQEKISFYQDQIKSFYTAKGVTFDGIHIENPTGQDKILNDIISKQQYYEAQYMLNECHIKALETIRDLCSGEVKEMIQKKFFEGKTWDWMQYEWFYKSSHAIRYQIRKELAKLVEH